MSRLSNFFNYELVKKKQLKENSSDDYYKTKLNTIHEYLYDCLRNYYKVENENGSLREYMYYRLYDAVCGLSNISSQDVTVATKAYIDKAYDIMIEMRNKLERYAYDSGDYGVYYDDAYNVERTRDNAHDYGLVKIVKDYFSTNVILRIDADIIDKAKKILQELEEDRAEPTFSGDFDEVQVSNSKEDAELKVFTSYCKELSQAYKNRDTQKIVNLMDIDAVKLELGNYDSFDYLWEDIEQIIYEAIDDYYANERQWDWIAYDEGDFNGDATWDRIYDLQTSNLMDDFFDQNDARELLEELVPILKVLFKMSGLSEFDLKTAQEKVPEKDSEETGDEYDE